MPRQRLLTFGRPAVNPLAARPELEERLDSLARSASGLWLCGPAGAGKSALASSYLARSPGDVLWLRLEARDADPGELLHHLHLGLGHVRGRRVRRPRLNPFDTPLDYLDSKFTELLDAAPADARWVIDNCEHLPSDSPVWALIASLLERLPAGRPLLFLSRDAVPPALLRLQVSRQLACLDWEDLRLTLADTAAIIKAVRGNADAAADAERLHARSGGWPAALVLLIQSGAIASGEQPAPDWDSAALFDYLAAEVIAPLEAQDRRLLWAASLLPFVDEELLRAAAGIEDAQDRLTRLRRMIPLFEASAQLPQTHLMHPLLRQFARVRCADALSAGEREVGQLAAAAALQKREQHDAAGALLLESGEWSALLELALKQADSLLADGRAATLERWLEALPEPMYAREPAIAYWLGAAGRFSAPDTAWPRLREAFARFTEQGDVTGQYKTWLALAEAMLVVFEDMRPLKHWIAEYDALRERHPRCPDLALRLKTIAMAGSVMSVVAPRHPRLARTMRVAEVGVRLVPFRTPRQGIFVYLLLHYASTGQVARMHAMARHLLPALDEVSLPGPLRLFAHAMVGLHQLIAGDDSPEQAIDGAIALSRQVGGGLFQATPASYRFYFEAISGNEAEAARRLADFVHIMRDGHRLDQANHDFMAAWLAALQGRSGEALELTAQSSMMCVQLDFDFGRALNANLRAQICADLVDAEGAMAALEELDALARDSGSELLAVMHGFARAWFSLRSADEAACLRDLAEVLPRAERQGVLAYPGFSRTMHAELARVALAAGMPDTLLRRMVRRWALVPESLRQSDEYWPWRVRVRTLGGLQITLDDGDVPMDPSRHGRPLELLCALLARGGSGVPKTTLSDDLWPDTEADKAAHALDNLLSRLRKLLGAQALEVRAGTVSLHKSACWVDIWALEALAGRDDALDHAELSVLRGLYRGPFLAGDDHPWVLPVRERLRSAFVRQVEQAGYRLQAEGRAADAVELWEHALGMEPLSEGIYLGLMRCHADNGRPRDALAVYQRCREIMEPVLGGSPGGALDALARQLSA